MRVDSYYVLFYPRKAKNGRAYRDSAKRVKPRWPSFCCQRQAYPFFFDVI
jgi:hypothetical protein